MIAPSDNEGSGRLRFAGFTAALFALLTVPRLLTHELWRDEAWLWLVVQESTSLADLGSRLGRTGQGALFPLLCYFASGFSTSPLAMQCVNLVLAAAGVFVFARWAPFNRTHCTLFVLGYLPFYEYAVISRHYAAGVLLLWLACAATRLRKPALALGAALGLLCQTTVYGLILAAAVAGGWLLARWLQSRSHAESRGLPSQLPLPSALAGAALAVAGALAGLVQLIPASATSFAEPWRFGWSGDLAMRVLQMPWRAFVPLPRPGLHFWNSNLLDPWPWLQAGAGSLVLLGALALLWPRKAALATMLIGAAGLGAFGYIKFIGAIRHDGHWWLLFIAALWVGGGLKAATSHRLGEGAFLALLSLHCVAGVYASFMDLALPFSNGARTAVAIRERGLDRLPLLGYREPPAATVALALGQPLFSPTRGVFVTHPDWGPELRNLPMPSLRCAARELAAREGRDIGLVINRELPAWPELDTEGSVVGAIQVSEDYHLYRLRFERLAETALLANCDLRRP